MPSSASEVLPLAVVVYESGFDIAPTLAEVRARLTARGDLALGGVLPEWGGLHSNGRHEMLLRDLASDGVTQISQELGAEADSCILDPDGFARARLSISRAIEAGCDIVFVGKFAKQEAAGQGVRSEIGDAMAAGIPTLVVMRDAQREAFEAFAGDDWTKLAPEVDAIVGWALAATGRAA